MPYIPNAIETNPCVVVGHDSEGQEIMEPTEDGDPNIACWSLYFHADGVGVVHIKDFATKGEVEQAADLLRLFMQAMGYPHV